ncbi:unnamed protein product, partial [marine sediment metagenome]
MIEAFKNTLQIAGKDLLDFFRNRMELVAFIIMPIFMMVMTGYIFPSGTSLKNITLGVVENDKGEISQNIVTVLENMKLGDKNDNIFLLERQPGNLEEAKQELKKGNLNAILIIPEGFSSDIKESRQGILTLIIDQSNPQISSILTGMMERIVDGLAGKVAVEKLVGMMATEPPTDKPAPSGSTIAPSLQSQPNPQ